MTNATPKQEKGFRLMSPERVKEIARLGGQTAHRNGRAHQFTSEEAREAARKGHEKRMQRSKAP